MILILLVQFLKRKLRAFFVIIRKIDLTVGGTPTVPAGSPIYHPIPLVRNRTSKISRSIVAEGYFSGLCTLTARTRRCDLRLA